MRNSLFACIAVSVSLVAGSLIATQSPAFAKTQYINEIVGKRWNVSGRVTGTVIYNPNGSASYRTSWGIRGKGEWRRSGNRMCVRWYAFQNGREGCFTIQKVSAQRFNTSIGLTLYR